MTHQELVDIGYKWCMSRCTFAFKELRTLNMETPDVIGFNSEGTFLLEAKTSKKDFLKDKEKLCRIFSRVGMGDWRFFITPEGLLKKEELPTMWGLIEVNAKGRAKVVHNPYGKGNIYHNWLRMDKNEVAERGVMFSALRRMEKNKVLQNNL